MLTNCLRILFIKVMTKRMQKQSLRYEKAYEEKLDAYYCARPMMAEETWANMKAFLPIYFGILVFMLIVGICYFVEESKTRKTFIAVFIFAIGIFFKITYYFIAKHYFRSWDGIKVTFFRRESRT